jgi:crotonobetainyl-CoA:carnitine CoA-transferase CaiB-like acyl-CoA transferase
MLLQGYRVLNLCNERGYLCGKLLTDLGADVIAVEPPGGNSARLQGPFYHDDPNHSLSWMYYYAGQRGITLNLDTIQGQSIFRDLVAKCDVVIESCEPGYLDARDVGYDSFSRLEPSIVMVSITPFGQDGPYSGYTGTDLVMNAMGGFLYVTGDPDRPPVRIGFPQSWLIAGAAASAGTSLALFHRTNTGEGQHVDVSVQAAVARTLDRSPAFWDVGSQVLTRNGLLGRPGGGPLRRMLWRCIDGYVSYALIGGTSGVRSMRGLIEWMDEVGFNSQSIKSIAWEDTHFTDIPQATLDITAEVLGDFFAMYTKKELWYEARERRLLLYPASSPREVYDHIRELSPQIIHKVTYPDLMADIEILGPFITIDENFIEPGRAPSLGEHNFDIYSGLLGFSTPDLIALREEGVV